MDPAASSPSENPFLGAESLSALNDSLLESLWDSFAAPALRREQDRDWTEREDCWLEGGHRRNWTLGAREASEALETPIFEIFDRWRDEHSSYIFERRDALTLSAIEDALREPGARALLAAARSAAEPLGEDPDSIDPEAIAEALAERSREESLEIPFDLDWTPRGSLRAKASVEFFLPSPRCIASAALAPALLDPDSDWPALLHWLRLRPDDFANHCRESALSDLESFRAAGEPFSGAAKGLRSWLSECSLESPWDPDPLSWPEPLRSRILAWGPLPEPGEAPALSATALEEAILGCEEDHAEFEIDAGIGADELLEHSLLIDWREGSPILGEAALSRTLLLPAGGDGLLLAGEPLETQAPLSVPAGSLFLLPESPEGPLLDVPALASRSAARLARQALIALGGAISPARGASGSALMEAISEAKSLFGRSLAQDPGCLPFLLQSLQALPDSEPGAAAKTSLLSALPPPPAAEAPFAPPLWGPMGSSRGCWRESALLALRSGWLDSAGNSPLRLALALGDIPAAAEMLREGADPFAPNRLGEPAAHAIAQCPIPLGPHQGESAVAALLSLPWPKEALLSRDAKGSSLLPKIPFLSGAMVLCSRGADPSEAFPGFSAQSLCSLEAAYLASGSAPAPAKPSSRSL